MRYVDASGKAASITLARRLPTSDPITELERAVVNAAVAYNSLSTIIRKHALADATDALIAGRRPRPRQVDSPDALQAAFKAVGLKMQANGLVNELFNALPEVGE